MTLPTFLGIGTQRGGTTWLDAQLRNRPDVYLPQRRKEARYFDRYYDRGLSWYEELFPSEEEASSYLAIGEITPGYLYHREAAERIHATLPSCRLIVVLRNPVDRAYSQFGLSVQNGYQGDFQHYIRQHPICLRKGYYSKSLSRYFERFPREQMLILIFEDLHRDRSTGLRSVSQFLQLPDLAGWPKDEEKARYPSQVPRSPKVMKRIRAAKSALRRWDMDWVVNLGKAAGLKKVIAKPAEKRRLDPAFRKLLLDDYTEEVDILSDMLERDLSPWLDQGSDSQEQNPSASS